MQSIPYLFAISGVKNSGKTTFIEKLVPCFLEKGYRVGVMKHDGHSFQADVTGTDSWRYLRSGAQVSLIYDDGKYMFTSIGHPKESDLLRLFDGCDVVILEGFKCSRYPKYEIIRSGNSDTNVCTGSSLLGVISDFSPVLTETIPLFSLERPQDVFEDIRKRLPVMEETRDAYQAFYEELQAESERLYQKYFGTENE